MAIYEILGYSYLKGFYVSIGQIEAKSELGAKQKARRQFGYEYADFAVFSISV
jgi:hypothetical protein